MLPLPKTSLFYVYRANISKVKRFYEFARSSILSLWLHYSVMIKYYLGKKMAPYLLLLAQDFWWI